MSFCKQFYRAELIHQVCHGRETAEKVQTSKLVRLPPPPARYLESQFDLLAFVASRSKTIHNWILFLQLEISFANCWMAPLGQKSYFLFRQKQFMRTSTREQSAAHLASVKIGDDWLSTLLKWRPTIYVRCVPLSSPPHRWHCVADELSSNAGVLLR